jgi:oligopeptide transport system substrate-binding protein
MRSRNFVRFMGTSLLVVALTTVGLVHAQDKKVITTGINMVGSDLETIDPGLAQTVSSVEIINELFVGLTTTNPKDNSLQTGIASSFDVSADKLTYTFHLADNIPWVHYNKDTQAVEEVKDDSGNVRMVTADDVVYGILRGLDPKTASPYAYVYPDFIAGAGDFEAGKAGADTVKVKAVDAKTVEISSPSAVGFAPFIYGLQTLRAVPKWAIDASGDKWTEAENINTYGPFALADWSHDTGLTLVKNTFWPATADIPAPKVDEVDFKFLDPQQQFAEYQAGNMDAISLDISAIDQVKADPDLSKQYVNGTSFCTYYFGFNMKKAPLDNVHLRKALSLAIDRQSIVDNVTKGGQIPAQWFARPGLTASPTLDGYPDLGIKSNNDDAKKELDLAKADLGGTIPQLTLAYGDTAGNAAISQAIQQMWTDTLGITVQLTAMDSKTYFSKVHDDPPMIYRSGWCDDYADADNFDNVVFHSGSTQNDTSFANADFDKLVDGARLETDLKKRTDAYAKAEDILVNQVAAMAPIYWYTTNLMIKPNIERASSVTGNEVYYLWDKS